MPDNRIQTIVAQEIAEATGFKPDDAESAGVFSWLVATGETIPAWWSQARDRRLSSIWKASSHLATAIYNTQAKMVGIDFTIVPIDTSNDFHMEQADALARTLHLTSGFGEGWESTYAKFIEDLLTQDNGGFMEVIGDGDPTGPIVGLPLAVRHLDSARCTRTGHPIYPVLFFGDDSKQYKLHWTRVLYMSQMPSPRREMHGVGVCGVSRCIEVAQTLMDMVRYKQERLGSRPHNQIIFGKGITGKTIAYALARVEEQMSDRGYTRYARTVAMGSENPEASLEKIDLTHLEPFDEQVSTNLGMFIIAAALGMDADEVWPIGGSNAGSQSEANLRRMRSRGRLPAQLTAELANQFNFKVLPPHLRLQFDFRDDEEDQQKALIRDIRGRNRERDLTSGSINIRTARKRMLIDGDVDMITFGDMELVDGRLPDGSPIAILFYDQDPVYQRHLTFMPDPLRFMGNIIGDDEMVDDGKVNEVIDLIQNQRQLVAKEWAMTRSSRKSEKIKNAFHALDWLEDQYMFAAGRGLPEVPVASRRARTDIRVAPAEVTPPPGMTSPAQQTAGGATTESENIEQNG